MQIKTACLIALFCNFGVCSIIAGDSAGQPKLYGYTDTPMLPGSEWHVHDLNRPQPPMVDPGPALPSTPPPADAIILFDGKDLSQWIGGDEKGVENGFINILKTGEISTRMKFGDCQLHLEWATPAVDDGGAMHWGNSGVFMLGLYELQIIESHDSKIYPDGIAGAIYGQTPPMVNASRKPGEWQSYDILFTAPVFDGEKVVQPAYFTVLWNGIVVQNHQSALGPTRHRALAKYDNKTTSGPVMLQLHGSALRYRNIWIRPLRPSK